MGDAYSSNTETNLLALEHSSNEDVVYKDMVVWSVYGMWDLQLSKLRYFTFTVIGITLLWPWNAFLSASSYYSDRFAYSPVLDNIYSSSMMTVFTLTSMTCNYYLAKTQEGVSYSKRIKLGFVITIFVFLFMGLSCIVPAFLEMNDKVFFALLMFMTMTSSIATSYSQNGTMAIVNVLGNIYANAVMVGQGIAGILSAASLVISVLSVKTKDSNKKISEQSNYGVFVYYTLVSVLAFFSIILFSWTNRYKKHVLYSPISRDQAEEYDITPNISVEGTREAVESIEQKSVVPLTLLWQKLKFIVLAILFVFAITLAFPVFASKVESVNASSGYLLFTKDIYIPFIFFIWNLGDLAARILCGMNESRFLLSSSKQLFGYSLLRIVFIPLLMTCKIYNDKEPIINSDLWYICLQFLFGLSNGQIATSCFMNVADHCDTDDEKEAAGGFTNMFLSLGLTLGSLFSYLLVVTIY